MIYIIGNTLFGYPKMSDIQIDYFKNSFIPFLKKVYREGDILVHTGNIFYNKQSTHFKVLKDTFDIFDELSTFIQIFVLKGPNDELSIDLISRKNIKIFKEIKKVKNIMFIPNGNFLMPDNDTEYLFYNNIPKEIKDIKKTFNGFYDNEKGNDININITSPYQLNKDYTSSPHGFYAFSLKQNEVRFIENNYSPKFKEIYIDDISQLNEMNTISNDFVDLIINSKVVEKTENKNKVDIFISKNDFHNVYFTESTKIEKDIKIKDNNDIRNILIDNAESDMVDHLNEIFQIYDTNKRDT